MYAAADASLVLQRRTVLDINLPGKIQTIMSSGRPIIAATHPEGEAAKIIREARAGIVVTPENAEELAQAILSLRRDSDLCTSLGCAGREYALKHFSRSNALCDYLEILERLVPEGAGKRVTATASMD